MKQGDKIIVVDDSVVQFGMIFGIPQQYQVGDTGTILEECNYIETTEDSDGKGFIVQFDAGKTALTEVLANKDHNPGDFWVAADALALQPACCQAGKCADCTGCQAQPCPDE